MLYNFIVKKLFNESEEVEINSTKILFNVKKYWKERFGKIDCYRINVCVLLDSKQFDKSIINEFIKIVFKINNSRKVKLNCNWYILMKNGNIFYHDIINNEFRKYRGMVNSFCILDIETWDSFICPGKVKDLVIKERMLRLKDNLTEENDKELINELNCLFDIIEVILEDIKYFMTAKIIDDCHLTTAST
jgi:hypothetical protein